MHLGSTSFMKCPKTSHVQNPNSSRRCRKVGRVVVSRFKTKTEGFKHWQWPWDILSQSSRLLQQNVKSSKQCDWLENPNIHKLGLENTQPYEQKNFGLRSCLKACTNKIFSQFCLTFCRTFAVQRPHKRAGEAKQFFTILPKIAKFPCGLLDHSFSFNRICFSLENSTCCVLCPPLQARSKPVLWGEIAYQKLRSQTIATNHERYWDRKFTDFLWTARCEKHLQERDYPSSVNNTKM